MLCKANTQSCNGNYSDGCEVNIMTNLSNCGACNHNCIFTDSHILSATCDAGTCVISKCASGYADCDGVPSNGCEASLKSDKKNCGVCSNHCQTAHVATSTCTLGVCNVTSCDSGWSDCDSEPSNGCEANLASSVANCGECFGSCYQPGVANAKCINRRCNITSCLANRADCDKDPATGCEADTTSSITCGRCGNNCNSFPQVLSSYCSAGKCVISSCLPGYADCDHNSSNGCEVDTTNSTDNCRQCGNNCSALPHVKTGSCSASSCSISCAGNYKDCDLNISNGCEVDISSTPTNCGSCGYNCNRLPRVSATICNQSSCVINSCALGWSDCDAEASNGCEANLASNVVACGSCFGSCYQPGVSKADCIHGKCNITKCFANRADCDKDPATGCEADTTSLYTCGRCGNNCIGLPHVLSSYCSAGKCVISSCLPGYADCDRNSSNGCEVDTTSSKDNCRECGNNCSALPHVKLGFCSASICSLSCAGNNYKDCDLNISNGCEADISNTSANCGSCGYNCNRLPRVSDTICNQSSCVINSCALGWSDCDSDASNGCEANLASNVATCGSCFGPCYQRLVLLMPIASMANVT